MQTPNRGARILTMLVSATALVAGTAVSGTEPRQFPPADRETHFAELLMLTDGAENAEAYFSRDGRQLVFQSNRAPYGCDQIYTILTTGGEPELISSGAGRTTCAYFAGPEDRYVIYATTALADTACPPPPDMSQGYVWAIYPEYDIVRFDRATEDLVRLTSTPGYDAEATLSPDGQTILFTSVRDGDLDLYTMDLDGGNVRRLTTTPGYDGGAFYSADGKQIVYRAHHPTQEKELANYRDLLARGLVRPSLMEIWVMDADGGNQRQVTSLGCASFAPYFHPSGEKIIFSSNHPEPRGREFDLWLVNVDGSGLEQVTFSPEFDGFPMWSPDGTAFVFCSNRHNSKPGETNVFITKWRD